VQQQLQAEGKENKKRRRICACGRKERQKKKKNKQALYNGGVGEGTIISCFINLLCNYNVQ
jgi:hypothetical protein